MSSVPPKSQAIVKREQTFSQLSTFLGRDGMKQRLAMALPKHMTPDRMIRIALSAASRQPLLLECTIESIALSLIRAAEFGLETDGWDAHLVPYKNKGVRECQLIPDYKGLVKLAYQSELVVSISAGAVRQGDHFEYQRGTDEFCRHKPSDEESGEVPAPLTHAWAAAAIKGGGSAFVVLNRREVMEHKRASQAAGSDFSPWNKPETEPAMWKKTAIRELCKMLPRSPTLREVLKHEEALDIGGQVLDGVVFDATSTERQEDPASEPQKPSRTEAASERLAGKQSDTEILTNMQAQYDACNSVDQAISEYDTQAGPSGWLKTEALRQRSSEMYKARKAQLQGEAFRGEGQG